MTPDSTNPTAADPLRVPLDLTGRCIETAVRRRHERCISRYFKGGEDPAAIEAEMELLREALETFDFARLRTEYADLRGGTAAPVALARDERRRPVILLHGRPVPPA